MVHSVVLIGNSKRREFVGFACWLCDQPQLRIDAHFATAADALAADDQILAQAELTIVLQSWSDQFTTEEAGALVGATLFRRLLCCYGPWCESDGRNRAVWPDAHRVPLRIARRIVEWEVLRLQRGEPAVPPTSARDEIFAYRLGEPEEWAPLPDYLNQTALVVGPDRVLRQTVADLLEEFGLHARATPLLDDHVDLTDTLEELSQAQVSLIVHDLDPWGEHLAASLDRVRYRFPQAEIVGTASMPDAGLSCETADVDLPYIVPKLDLDDSLRWMLHELSQPRRLPA
ncbi:MAG: hypothetical protein NXI04_06270 [Planctomycetaceae bacterium]|nr:hypothetical protein [Planctomycetaceae bacterium]